ncbi:SRPBCC family protein [Oscillochloris sp. ZM17-4]|uniref:SRPBCC family protein n=1 Tax=Oscillochloris sp. ZM17-4 TaxID=2866714 RepID=UPI001C7331EB|nr:SRPBCC family protein [Oscillochloris sp. ZM17-4]MBX0329339.1 SRPBCC family protein [Oscillochloris sp. ZM17-4]
MITVTRRSYIESATPAEIFDSLSDPSRIGQLLPRVQKVEMLSRDMETRTARLVTHMSLGGIFGTIRCEGDLTWEEPGEILFKVRTPVPVETRWTLTSAVNGTDLQATMSLDLAPMLGPMAAFVPVQTVGDMLAKELESALKAISESSAAPKPRERAVAA